MIKINYISSDTKSYKYVQVRDELIRIIEENYFKKDTKLPSISEICAQHNLSKATVERAYWHLRNRGYINYIAGKGFYLTEPKKDIVKVLLVFNKLSYYKKIIYEGIVGELGARAKIDLKIHQYDVVLLDEIVSESLGKYDYYVIMPHFKHQTLKRDYTNILKKIPNNQLIILDKQLPDYAGKYCSVYQDFKEDMFNALESLLDLFPKYDHLKLVLPPDSNHPIEIIAGASSFCMEHEIEFSLIENTDVELIVPRTAYIVIEELELAELIKNVRKSNYVIGKDIGIIAFNETVLKELLEITVISTDFSNMGRKVGELILNKKNESVKNPFKIHRRKSF
jgi:DNA-binding transcriptional regulator YhcF (GntR family)